MFKSVKPFLLSFDIEWIPDPMAAEALFGVAHNPPYSLPDAFNRLWELSGATAEAPRPFVKTLLCRIVSIAGVFREATADGPALKLVSLPADPDDPAKANERAILDAFLRATGKRKPQLVGFNSLNSDVPILLQRAVVNGLDGHGFGARPDKPWEGVDYFSGASDWHVDLAGALGWGRNTPRLDEAARLCGIPGKVDASGDQVWALYMKGDRRAIVQYNEFDALTTHLLWARMAHFGGLLTSDAYEAECDAVATLIENEIAAGREHLHAYRHEWTRLQGLQNRFLSE
mgnify:CR=1 FL=1